MSERHDPLPEIIAQCAIDPRLSLAQVEAIVCQKKSWIYARVDRGEFPPPDEGRWYASEVREYLELRKAGRLHEARWPERRRAA